MQEITERYTRRSRVYEVANKLLAEGSDELHEAFAMRRLEAEKRHQQRLDAGEQSTLQITEARNIGRNDPCPCGSKIKFKKCCGSRLAVDDERVK